MLYPGLVGVSIVLKGRHRQKRGFITIGSCINIIITSIITIILILLLLLLLLLVYVVIINTILLGKTKAPATSQGKQLVNSFITVA